jgi:hypothetical protein
VLAEYVPLARQVGAYRPEMLKHEVFGFNHALKIGDCAA